MAASGSQYLTIQIGVDSMPALPHNYYLYLLRTQWRTPPNLITGLRLVGAVGILVLILTDQPWIAAGLFILSATTDWVDGYLAKRNNGKWMSDLGKLADPVVDKLLVLLAILGVVIVLGDPVVTVVFVITMARECLVYWSKQTMHKLTGIIEPAIQSSRVSMVIQSIAVSALLISLVYEQLYWPALVLLSLGLTASIFSGQQYYLQARAVQKRHTNA